MEWTLETYRLDEVERKFELPCVIHVNEGYYSETDTEGFSQGDIMSIDSKMTLHKVAANFAYDEGHDGWQDPNYVKLTEKEILVPLNYKGKLRVLKDMKNFDCVRELARDFPRYAKLRENKRVTTEDNIPVTIQAGTMIELDRIIPGSQRDPGKLVIQFQHRKNLLVVAVPLTDRGKFRTEPDNNEYTIKEAINRYSLPQIITFVDDEIKRVYTQDLLEGIENMRTITAETLRLNRLVTQNVLVGHYKPLEDTETVDTGRFRQRTLVVLPIDNPEIRDIEVNVLKGMTDDIYEEVFLVRNVSLSNTGDLVDGSLYVDFAMSPGIKLIAAGEDKNQTESESEEKPPPRPPKPGYLKSPKPEKQLRKPKRPITDNGEYLKYNPTKDEKKSSSPHRHYRKPPPPVKTPHSRGSDVSDDYIEPEIPDATYEKKSSSLDTHYQKPPPPIKTSVSESSDASALGDYLDFNLADVNFGMAGSGTNPLETKTSKSKDFLSNLKSKLKSKDKATTHNEEAQKKKAMAKVQPIPTVPDNDDEEDVEELPEYDEVDEWTMDDASKKHKSPSKATLFTNKAGRNKNTHPKSTEKPTALVSPSNNRSEIYRKEFKDLNNEELVERLTFCELKDFAEFCRNEKLNGAFFTNVPKEILTNEMNLSGIPLFKFIQMRDHNWVPT